MGIYYLTIYHLQFIYYLAIGLQFYFVELEHLPLAARVGAR